MIRTLSYFMPHLNLMIVPYLYKTLIQQQVINKTTAFQMGFVQLRILQIGLYKWVMYNVHMSCTNESFMNRAFINMGCTYILQQSKNELLHMKDV